MELGEVHSAPGTPPVSPFLPPWCQLCTVPWHRHSVGTWPQEVTQNIYTPHQIPFIHHPQAHAQGQQQSQGTPLPSGLLCPLVVGPLSTGFLSGPSCAVVGTGGSGGQVAHHSDWGCGCSWGSRSGWGALCWGGLWALQDNSLQGQEKAARGHVPSRVMTPPSPISHWGQIATVTRVMSPPRAVQLLSLRLFPPRDYALPITGVVSPLTKATRARGSPAIPSCGSSRSPISA